MTLERFQYYADKSNVVIGIAIMILAVILFISDLGVNLISYIFPVYIGFFGLMMVANEFKIEWITGYCGFLRHYIGRGIFNIYLASLCYYYSFSGDALVSALGYAGLIVLSITGVFFLVFGIFASRSSGSGDGLLGK